MSNTKTLKETLTDQLTGRELTTADKPVHMYYFLSDENENGQTLELKQISWFPNAVDDLVEWLTESYEYIENYSSIPVLTEQH